MTINEIKERLRANGNPSLFEEAVLDYIEELELRVKTLHKELAAKHYAGILKEIEDKREVNH